jgi:hypothetical protein
MGTRTTNWNSAKPVNGFLAAAVNCCDDVQ